MNLQLRKATVADSRFLFELRNDASVREVSFSTEPIPFESHEKWLAKKLADTTSTIFIAETKGGVPLAQIRFDLVDEKTAEVSIAVAKEYRGKGYGSHVLSSASRRFFEEHPSLAFIRARIKTSNGSSLRSFEKSGYKRIETDALHDTEVVEMLLTHPSLQMRIGERYLGGGAPCFIVAEISGNHHQKYEEAVALLRAAKEAGADAVKLQTYTPDTITLNSDNEWFRVNGIDNPAGWKGKTLYELYQEAYTPWEWQPKLKKLADEMGIILFSTPFDETAVDFLEKMNVPCYKIASYEATDFLLLQKVARTKRPVILSVGYATEDEIKEAVATLRQYGTTNIAVLHCVTGYGAEPAPRDMHLRTIADISARFGVVSGFSDNNAGIFVPQMAVHAGASIIEKHLILDRNQGGPDARFSLEPAELKELVANIREVEAGQKSLSASEELLGTLHYGPSNGVEEYNKRFRRSLFSGKDIKKGELFTKENVRDVRPGLGLPTKHFDEIIGKHATKNIPFATPLSWKMIS